MRTSVAPRAYPWGVDRCAECGFDYGALEQSRLAGEITQQAALVELGCRTNEMTGRQR